MLPSLFKGGSDAEKQPASSSRTGNIGPKSPPQSQHHSIVRAQGAAQGARKVIACVHGIMFEGRRIILSSLLLALWTCPKGYDNLAIVLPV